MTIVLSKGFVLVCSHKELIFVLDQLWEERLVVHTLATFGHFCLHEVNYGPESSFSLSFRYFFHSSLESWLVREVVLNVGLVGRSVLIHQLRVDLSREHSWCCGQLWLNYFVNVVEDLWDLDEVWVRDYLMSCTQLEKHEIISASCHTLSDNFGLNELRPQNIKDGIEHEL